MDNITKTDMQHDFTGKKVLVSAGGTGGHVYPALAVAQRLRECGADVEWIGTSAGIEARLVPDANIPLHTIFVQGLRGNGISRLVKAPFVIASAVVQARRVVKAVNPDVFIGFGGFASGPGAVAAKLCGVPVIVHEQNAAMGMTNKIVSKWATQTLLAFPIAGMEYPVVGNPIREEILSIPEPQERVGSDSAVRVLVVGGSLGARALNRTVPQALQPLLGEIELTHQTGAVTYEETIASYQSLSLQNSPYVTVTQYIDDIKNAYQHADLLIARAGASTVSEVASIGLGAIFIPLPHAVDNHQMLNAQFLANESAAVIIQESELTAELLRTTVSRLLEKRQQLITMAENGRKVSHAGALDAIITIIQEVIDYA